MDSARDTVLQLEVHLGNGVFWEYRCVRDITCAKLLTKSLRIRSSDMTYEIAALEVYHIADLLANIWLAFAFYRKSFRIVAISMSQVNLVPRYPPKIKRWTDFGYQRTVNLLIALSLGVQREQLLHLNWVYVTTSVLVTSTACAHLSALNCGSK